MFPILFTIPKVHLGATSLGPIPIHSYGVMLIIGFLVAAWLIRKRSPLYAISQEKIIDMPFWGLIAGVLGARIGFILQELPHYLAHRDELFSLQFSGLTSFGGEIAGFLAVAIWARRMKYPMVSIMDLAAPGYIVGYAIGRIGCFLNGCCYGGVCSPSLPWAVKFQDAPGYHHPAQLYDTLMSLAVLFVLLKFEKLKPHAGKLTALMLILHGTTRFIYEFWRAGTDSQVAANLASSTYWGKLPITQAQALALVFIAVGGVWFYLAGRKQPATSGPEPAEIPAA